MKKKKDPHIPRSFTFLPTDFLLRKLWLRCVLLPICGFRKYNETNDLPSVEQLNSMTYKLLRSWWARVYALGKAEQPWAFLTTPETRVRLGNCPPLMVGTWFTTYQCRCKRLCPSCYGRLVAREALEALWYPIARLRAAERAWRRSETTASDSDSPPGSPTTPLMQLVAFKCLLKLDQLKFPLDRSERGVFNFTDKLMASYVEDTQLPVTGFWLSTLFYPSTRDDPEHYYVRFSGFLLLPSDTTREAIDAGMSKSLNPGLKIATRPSKLSLVRLVIWALQYPPSLLYGNPETMIALMAGCQAHEPAITRSWGLFDNAIDRKRLFRMLAACRPPSCVSRFVRPKVEKPKEEHVPNENQKEQQ